VLFPYKYVNHSIEQFQEYLEHLVKEVWCKRTEPFSVDMLHPMLREIVLDLYNVEDDTTRGRVHDWLFGPIFNIYELCKGLEVQQRQRIATWFDNNNDVEALCANDPVKIPVTYADIHSVSPALATVLKAFCESLFSTVIGLKAVQQRIGEIDDHYDAFVTVNAKRKCPYCGLNDLKGPYQSKRDPYDHFLPKATYPFNSVNFRNLAPMCVECNSSYKSTKDLTRGTDPICRKSDHIRRKAFYSYAAVAADIKITVKIKTKDVLHLLPSEIELFFACPTNEEQVEGWKEVFGIEERYKAKLCSESDGKAWLQRITEEGTDSGLSRDQVLEYELRAANRMIEHDAGFLKIPFLRACREAKII
jgi:hypothetical protein